MNCEQTKLRLGEFLDGELDEDTRWVVEQHLDECSECRSEYNSLRSLTSALASRPEVTVPSALWEAIEERLPQASRAPSAPHEHTWRRVFLPPLKWRPLAAAAAILLAVGLGWLAWNTPWESTAMAAQIDFRPLLEQADGNIESGIDALLRAYGGESISPADASERMKIRIRAIDELPAEMQSKSMHLLKLGQHHEALAFHFVGPRGQLLLLQCPPGTEKGYGDHECLPCRVGAQDGHIVRAGALRLLHFDSENVCVCVVSTLDEHRDLPAVLDALRIEF